MKSKDEVTLDTLKTLLDIAETLLGDTDEEIRAEVQRCRDELAETFELRAGPGSEP